MDLAIRNPLLAIQNNFSAMQNDTSAVSDKATMSLLLTLLNQ